MYFLVWGKDQVIVVVVVQEYQKQDCGRGALCGDSRLCGEHGMGGEAQRETQGQGLACVSLFTLEVDGSPVTLVFSRSW